MNKCRRCKYHWLPVGTREVRGYLYMLDLGYCPVCCNVKSRVKTASPGDQVSAMLWGQGLELIRREHDGS